MTKKPDLTEDEIMNSLKGKLEGVDPRVKGASAEEKMEETLSEWEKIKQFSNNPNVVEQVEHDGVSLPIRILASKEIIEVERETQKWFSKIPEIEAFPGLRNWYYMVALLEKSLYPKPHITADLPYLNAKALKCLPMGSLTSLFKKWEMVQEKYNFDIEALTNDEFNHILTSVKKNPRYLKELTYPQLLAVTIKLCSIPTLLGVDSPTQQ